MKSHRGLKSNRTWIPLFCLILLGLSSVSPRVMAQPDFRDGGMPLKFKEVRGNKSKKQFLLVTTTGTKSKYLFKLLSMEDGQPRTLKAREDVITRIDGREQVDIDAMVAAIQRPAFTIHVRRLKAGKFVKQWPEVSMLVLTRTATRAAANAQPLTAEQRLLSMLKTMEKEAMGLVAYRDNRLLPIYQKVKKVRDVWETLSPDESRELVSGMTMLDARHGVLSEQLDEMRRVYVFDHGEKSEEIESLLRTCQIWIEFLDDFNGLRNDLLRIETLKRKFQAEALALSQAIERFQDQVKQDRQRQREQQRQEMLEAFEQIGRQMLAAQDRYETGLRELAVDIAIRQAEIEEYEAEIERYNAEVDAYNAQVEADYYAQVDYGDDGWSPLQYGWNTQQFLSNTWYSSNWNHRPVQDGRQ